MIELVKFKKHPTIPGIQCRVITRKDAETEARLEREAGVLKNLKASARWLRPIPSLDWPQIERIAERTWFGLGGEIADVTLNRGGVVESGGRYYAVRWLSLYIAYANDQGRVTGEAISDSINVTIYRDPKRPRLLRLMEGHKQFKPE